MHYESTSLNQFQWSLDISLQDDFNLKVFHDLHKAGYRDATQKDAVYQYFNLRKRQVEKRPRKVFLSKEFTCPAGYEIALKEFLDKVERGANLIPFQSQKIMQSHYDDLLLNDWGIQHFHLSRRYRDDGFVQRSPYQIFAYVNDETMYGIQIYPHNADNLYSKREMIRILRDNWPDLLERFHLKDISGLTKKIDDYTYGQLREAHVTTLLELGENEVYALMGGGYASNGFSTEALRNADFWMNRLGEFQQAVVSKAEWIGKTINYLLGVEAAYCNLKIELLWISEKDEVTMCERNSSHIVQLNAKESWLWICKPWEVLGDGKLYS